MTDSLPASDVKTTSPVSPTSLGSSVTHGFELFSSVTHGIEEKATQFKAIASPTIKAITSPKLLHRVASLSIKQKFKEGASSLMSFVSSGINKDYEIHNTGKPPTTYFILPKCLDLTSRAPNPLIVSVQELGKGHFGVVKPAVHRKTRQVNEPLTARAQPAFRAFPRKAPARPPVSALLRGVRARHAPPRAPPAPSRAAQPAAVKIVSKRRKSDHELALIRREIEIMARIHHPNCVSYYAREPPAPAARPRPASREGAGR